MSKNHTSGQNKLAQFYKDMVAPIEHRVTEVWLQCNPSNHPVLCTTSAIADDMPQLFITTLVPCQVSKFIIPPIPTRHRCMLYGLLIHS